MNRFINVSLIVNLFITAVCSSVVYAQEQASGSRSLVGYEPVQINDALAHIRFEDEVKPVFAPSFFEDLRAMVKSAGDYKNLVIEAVGHSDNAKLSAAARARYGSNQKLSELRAKNVAEAIKNKTNFADVSFKSAGFGGSQPIADNDSAAGRAKNNRAQINISYSRPVYQQQQAAAVIATPVGASDAKAREALATPEDAGDDTLEEALTAVDENYTLVGKSRFDMQYSYNFSYSAGDSIITNSDGSFLGVVQDGRATHGNRISVSYGLLDNISLGMSLPLISTSTLGEKIKEDGIGDMSFSARWQPWPVRLGKPNLSLSLGVGIPTGTSPYDIDINNTLPTGSGVVSYSLSANVNKLIDPMVVYGSVSYSQAMDKEDLSQERYGKTLVAVRPAGNFGYSIGMGYALTYGVSISTGFSHTFGSKTEYEFSDGMAEAFGGHSATYNIGVGFRTAPSTVLNVSLGIGLTRESSDFSIGFSVPFSIKGLRSH